MRPSETASRHCAGFRLSFIPSDQNEKPAKPSNDDVAIASSYRRHFAGSDYLSAVSRSNDLPERLTQIDASKRSNIANRTAARVVNLAKLADVTRDSTKTVGDSAELIDMTHGTTKRIVDATEGTNVGSAWTGRVSDSVVHLNTLSSWTEEFVCHRQYSGQDSQD